MPLDVSHDFKRAAGKLHRPTRRVAVIDADDVEHDMLIRSGTLSWTAGGYPSCQGSIEVADLSDHPLTGSSWLLPYGSRVKVWAGVESLSAGTHEVLVADLVLTSVEEQQPEQTLTLTVASDEELLRTDAFATPVGRYTLSGDSGMFQQLQSIVWRTLPTCTIVVDDTLIDPGCPPDTVWDGDAWGCAQDCLEALEAEAYVTPDRVLHLRPAAVKAGTPDDTVTQGKATSTVVGATSTWNRGVNTVTLRAYDADNDGISIVGEASRTGAQDPTGAMGPVRLVVERPAEALEEDLTTAAEGLLRLTSRRNRVVTVDTMPRPWLTVGDTVRLVWADDTTEDLLVRSVGLSLTPGDPMTLELGETWTDDPPS